MKWKRQCADISECNTSNVRQRKKATSTQKINNQAKKEIHQFKGSSPSWFAEKNGLSCVFVVYKETQISTFFVRNFMIIEWDSNLKRTSWRESDTFFRFQLMIMINRKEIVNWIIMEISCNHVIISALCALIQCEFEWHQSACAFFK